MSLLRTMLGFGRRSYTPSRTLDGLGSGVLAGLAMAELLSGSTLNLAVLLAAFGVGAVDRFSRKLLSKVAASLAAIFVIGRVLDGQNCLGLTDDLQVRVAGPLVAMIMGAWLVAVVISFPSLWGFQMVGRALSLLALLFGLGHLGIFVLSPAGLPVVLVYTEAVTGFAIVLLLGFGVAGGFDPESALDVIGWTLAAAQIFIVGYLATQPWTDCASHAFTGAVVGLVAGAGAVAMGRLRP